MKIVGVDIGTTTISMVVVEEDSLEAVERHTIPNNCFLSGRPWERVQDAEEIVRRAKETLDQILDEYPDIAAIGLTGQMHGIVYADAAGRVLSPLYTWQDGGGNQPLSDGRSVCSILSEEYGITAATGYGMVTYLYHCKTGEVPAGAASICTIADYFGMVLTERTTPLVHISQAASLGLYDLQNGAFLLEILGQCGGNPDLAPEITADAVPLGTYRGIPVCVSLGDNQASFLGTVRDGANTVLVNVGTGAQVSVLSAYPYAGHGIDARPFTKDAYLLVGAAICGGAAYAALEQFFRSYAVAAGALDVPQYAVMKRLLEQQTDPAETLMVKTTFLGTRENPDETGSISGITIVNFHPAALIRGTLNGMAEELHGLYQVLQERAGISRSKLLASGNGVRRNEFLQKILGDTFALPCTVHPSEEEAACGAAICGIAMRKGTGLERWLLQS